MNLNTNIARPKFKSMLLTQRGPAPASLWTKCSEWDALPHHRELEHGESAGPNSDHHMAIASSNCFLRLIDDEACEEIKVLRPPVDSLNINGQVTHMSRPNSDQAKRGSTQVILLAKFKIPKT